MRDGDDRPQRPTREAIEALPPFDGLPLARIELVKTPEQAETALAAIRDEGCVGFDTESKPTFTRDAVRDGPHVVQFALQARAFIVQVGEGMPLDFLRAVLESDDMVKVGFGLGSDRQMLHRKLGVTLAATVDLATALRSLRYRDDLGVKAAVAIVLGRRMRKSRSVTTSNWAQRELTAPQLLYAANDAYAALEVWRALGRRRSEVSST